MPNNQTDNKHKFDLERRTTDFAKQVVRLCKQLQRNPINDRMISQVVGSAGSIGANYREANDALGKKDFLLRMRIARKEAKECMHWLELLAEANPEDSESLRKLWQECQELKNILSTIIANSEKHSA